MNRNSFLYGVAVVVTLMIGGIVSAQGQNVYHVRAGATGSGNGLDWANAYPALPATLQRGATYYIASGTYGSYRFNTAPSGTTVITIKKATQSEHGTDTGWVSNYGSGQAVWTGVVYFDTSYWVFDGKTRNETDWFVGASYGFRIRGDEQQIAMGWLYEAVSNIQIRNTYLQGPNSPLSPTVTGRRYGLDMYNFGGSGTFAGLVVSRCLFRFGNVPVFCGGDHEGLILEYSAFDANDSNAANHGEAVSAFWTCNRFVIRFNKFRNIRGTAVVAFCGLPGGNVDGFQIYGNLIWNCSVGDGVFGFSLTDRTFSNCKIYNNTIADREAGNMGVAIPVGTGNEVFNNLWVNCADGFGQGGGATYRNNAYSWNSADPTAQNNVPTDIFADYARQDYRLTYPTAGGVLLPAPYNVDLYGRIRGGDGTWDRGAFEYDRSRINPVVVVSPAELGFGSVPTNTSSDLSFTVQNIGAGTLAGSVSVAAPFSILSGGTYSLGPNQRQSVIVRYRPVVAGTNTQTATFTGGGGATVSVSGVGQ